MTRGSVNGGMVTDIAGVAMHDQSGILNVGSKIYLSSHTSLEGFTSTLNHELIHTYHNSLGYARSLLGNGYRNATEHSAYLYSYLTAPNSSIRMNSTRGLLAFPSSYRLGWPSYLLPFH